MQILNKLVQYNNNSNKSNNDQADGPASSNVPTEYFYLLSEWTDNVLKIQLLDTKTKQCSKGELYVGFQELSAELAQNCYGYLQTMKKAMTASNIGTPRFLYTIDYTDNEFQVLKQGNGGVEIHLLSIPLKAIERSNDLLVFTIEMLNASEQQHLLQQQQLHQQLQQQLQQQLKLQLKQQLKQQQQQRATSISRIAKCASNKCLRRALDSARTVEKILLKKFGIMQATKNHKIQQMCDSNRELRDTNERLREANEQLKVKLRNCEETHAAIDDADVYLTATLPLTPPPVEYARHLNIFDDDDDDD